MPRCVPILLRPLEVAGHSLLHKRRSGGTRGFQKGQKKWSNVEVAFTGADEKQRHHTWAYTTARGPLRRKPAREKKEPCSFFRFVYRTVIISGVILARCCIPGGVQQVLQLSESLNSKNPNQEIQPGTAFLFLTINRRAVLLCISSLTDT